MHNKCSDPEEYEVPESLSKADIDEPILQHLLTVVNKTTRKSPLVTSCTTVQSAV